MIFLQALGFLLLPLVYYPTHVVIFVHPWKLLSPWFFIYPPKRKTGPKESRHKKFCHTIRLSRCTAAGKNLCRRDMWYILYSSAIKKNSCPCFHFCPPLVIVQPLVFHFHPPKQKTGDKTSSQEILSPSVAAQLAKTNAGETLVVHLC